MPRLILSDEEMTTLLHEVGIQDAPDDFMYDENGDTKNWDYHRNTLYAKLRAFRRGQRGKTKEKAHAQHIWDAIKDASKV
jgi:hypothetical protein